MASEENPKKVLEPALFPVNTHGIQHVFGILERVVINAAFRRPVILWRPMGDACNVQYYRGGDAAQRGSIWATSSECKKSLGLWSVLSDLDIAIICLLDSLSSLWTGNGGIFSASAVAILGSVTK